MVGSLGSLAKAVERPLQSPLRRGKRSGSGSTCDHGEFRVDQKRRSESRTTRRGSAPVPGTLASTPLLVGPHGPCKTCGQRETLVSGREAGEGRDVGRLTTSGTRRLHAPSRRSSPPHRRQMCQLETGLEGNHWTLLPADGFSPRHEPRGDADGSDSRAASPRTKVGSHAAPCRPQRNSKRHRIGQGLDRRENPHRPPNGVSLA